MARFKLLVEYHGTPYVGWQRQDNGPSVQGELEKAIFKLAGEQVTVTAAGRTDAGVHATGQVVHFDLAKDFSADRVQGGLNFHLKPHPDRHPRRRSGQRRFPRPFLGPGAIISLSNH